MPSQALVADRDDLRQTLIRSDQSTESATTMSTLTHPPTLTSTDTDLAREARRADTTLRRLDQLSDDQAVDGLLMRLLARRRARRHALRLLAVQQARQEHELQMQRALLGTGLTHLR